MRIAKSATRSVPQPASVRSRRAYFDCKSGQLHVRTAFPGTGGFDEQTTLICLHPTQGSSRVFARLLPLLAADRSVYAPDLPGHGESDPPAAAGIDASAGAVVDLAADLRLRQIDLLGLQDGSAVAVALALAHPELVRALVLIGGAPLERLARLQQPCLVLRIGAEAAAHAVPGTARLQVVNAPEYAADLLDAAPQTLATQAATFLARVPRAV